MNKKAQAARILELAFAICIGHSQLANAGDIEMPKTLRFSSDDKADQASIDKRDMSKPFYFKIATHNSGEYPFTVDIGSTFRVWLDRRVPEDTASPAGAEQRSLALSLFSDYNRDVKDKIFFDAVPHGSPSHIDADGPNNEHFVSFDFLLDKTYEVPRRWAIHFQAWQCCGGHPPFTITVNPDESDAKQITMELRVANDETEALHYGKPVTIGKFSVPRETWTHVTLDLKPSPCSLGHNGWVKSWVNGRKVSDWHGCWGYQPMAWSPTAHARVTHNIGLDIGVYRPRQATRQTILVDNIRFGTVADSRVR